jgi:hypothetical protein
MNRTRFHDILHGNSEVTPIIRTNQKPMVFHLKKIRKVEGIFGLDEEEKDKVDILYDLSCNYFYLSNWEKEESLLGLEQENIHLSEIYVGDYQEKDIYYTNPLLEEK